MPMLESSRPREHKDQEGRATNPGSTSSDSNAQPHDLSKASFGDQSSGVKNEYRQERGLDAPKSGSGGDGSDTNTPPPDLKRESFGPESSSVREQGLHENAAKSSDHKGEPANPSQELKRQPNENR